jgi:hypothetical protein
MLSINQCFGRHCCYHLQGKFVVGQVLEALSRAGGELDLMVLIGRAEVWAAIQWEKGIFLRKIGYGTFFMIT